MDIIPDHERLRIEEFIVLLYQIEGIAMFETLKY